jgi:hypothetical protein
LLAEASFKNVTAGPYWEKRGRPPKWQHRGERFPQNARQRGQRGTKKLGPHRRCSPNSATHLPKGSDHSNSASHLIYVSQLVLTRYLSNRQIGASAELQGSSLFTTASRQRNNGHDGRDHDHALNVHGLLSLQRLRQSHHLATGAGRSDQEDSSLSKGFPRWLMRKSHG